MRDQPLLAQNGGVRCQAGQGYLSLRQTELRAHYRTINYTTNPTERSTSKIVRSTSEIVLDSSVESKQALAECSTSNDRACLSSAHRVLDGILQAILRQFCSSSEKICSSSAQWD